MTTNQFTLLSVSDLETERTSCLSNIPVAPREETALRPSNVNGKCCDSDPEEEAHGINCGHFKRLKRDMGSDTDDSIHDSDMDLDYGSDDQPDVVPIELTDQRPLAERCFGPPVKYNILDLETTYTQMISCVNESTKFLQLPPTTIRVLLNHRQWDKERLFDHYYESDDVSKVFKAAGIIDPNISIPGVRRLTGPAECGICYENFFIENSFTANCGHCFCSDCWTKYLLAKVMDQVGEEKIECPAHFCKFLLEDDIVMEKVNLPDARQKYKKLITGSYIQSNRLLQWCPGPGCDKIVALEQGPVSWRPVTCSCAYCFCFNCSDSWHGPVKCHWIKKWNKKCSDDFETVNWISVNTKSCPKCEAPIEKNGGCNHMRCSTSTCKYEFCWICLGEWAAHGGQNYLCNRFQEPETMSATLAQNQQSLRRYLFYFDRHFNHSKSLKSENKLNESMDIKMKSLLMLTEGLSLYDLEFLKHGIQVLCQCRQTLMYTYVFAYFLTRNNAANIFEDNQNDLQRATEELSDYLERDINETKGVDDKTKRKVIDMTKYCESRCQVLLKHVYEGYEEENYWSYIDSVPEIPSSN